jgi:hypothetical protein
LNVIRVLVEREAGRRESRERRRVEGKEEA